MTKSRNQFIYKLKGTLTSRQLCQAPPESKYAGQDYFRLKVKLADYTTKSISVFKEKLANQAIWVLLENNHRALYGRQYIFRCRNVRGYYHLVDWEEIPLEKSPTKSKGGQP